MLAAYHRDQSLHSMPPSAAAYRGRSRRHHVWLVFRSPVSCDRRISGSPPLTFCPSNTSPALANIAQAAGCLSLARSTRVLAGKTRSQVDVCGVGRGVTTGQKAEGWAFCEPLLRRRDERQLRQSGGASLSRLTVIPVCLLFFS